MMNLDEAIRHHRALAQSDAEQAQDHEQVAAWLDELRDCRTPAKPDLAEILETLESQEAMLADGFMDALVGYVERAPGTLVALYDRARCIDILMRDSSMDRESAEEFFDFNVLGAWVGDGTPAFATFARSQTHQTG